MITSLSELHNWNQKIYPFGTNERSGFYELWQQYKKLNHGDETVFLPADGEASWLLLPSSVFLLSGSTVQPENSYSHILRVTGQV